MPGRTFSQGWAFSNLGLTCVKHAGRIPLVCRGSGNWMTRSGQSLNRLLQHLKLVAGQEHYTSTTEFCRSTIPQHHAFRRKISPEFEEAVVQHYSFDFAQQILVPNSSQHVRPLYFFFVPYKLALFGVTCEPLGKMVIYVIPESVLVGKGANMVISLLHHFLAKYSSGETHSLTHSLLRLTSWGS